MAKDKTKNEGPSCACGKQELYEPLEKLNKKDDDIDVKTEDKIDASEKINKK